MTRISKRVARERAESWDRAHAEGRVVLYKRPDGSPDRATAYPTVDVALDALAEAHMAGIIAEICPCDRGK